MTRTQKAQLRCSELREKMGALLDTELAERSETYDADLSAAKLELRSAESDLQAALLVEAEPQTVAVDSERRELDALIAGASVGDFIGAVLEQRSVEGRMRELQQHLNLESNQLPLDVLRIAHGDLEERVATGAPTDVGQNQQMILPYVFPASTGAFLGIPTPTVPVGEAVYPVLTSDLVVRTPAEAGSAAETDGTFSGDVLSPARLQASFFWSVEDQARFRGMEEALRQNLSEGLADGLDKQIINGSNGLLNGTNLANHNVTAQTSYALYRSQFAYGRIDGRYASMTDDLRVVMGAETYAHAAGQYRGNNDNTDALAALNAVTGGVRVSAHVPDAAGTPAKQNAVIRLGMAQAAVAPIWQGVSFIRDQVTKAGSGQVVLTAIMLHAVKILRADDFYKQQTQHA